MSVVHTSTELAQLELSSAGSEFLNRSDRSLRCRQLAERGFLIARVVPLPSSDDRRPRAQPSRESSRAARAADQR